MLTACKITTLFCFDKGNQLKKLANIFIWKEVFRKIIWKYGELAVSLQLINNMKPN